MHVHIHNVHSNMLVTVFQCPPIMWSCMQLHESYLKHILLLYFFPHLQCTDEDKLALKILWVMFCKTRWCTCTCSYSSFVGCSIMRGFFFWVGCFISLFQAPSLLITLINMFLKFGMSPTVDPSVDPDENEYSVFSTTQSAAKAQVELNYPFRLITVHSLPFVAVFSGIVSLSGCSVCPLDVTDETYLPLC